MYYTKYKKNVLLLKKHTNSHWKSLLLSTMPTLVLHPVVSLWKTRQLPQSCSSESSPQSSLWSQTHREGMQLWSAHRNSLSEHSRGTAKESHPAISGKQESYTEDKLVRAWVYSACWHSCVPSPSHLLGQADYVSSKTRPSTSILRMWRRDFIKRFLQKWFTCKIIVAFMIV